MSFPEHDGVKLDSLNRIYRGDDGFVRFMEPSAGGLQPIRSIRRDQLEQRVPQIQDRLAVDGYVSVNAFYRDGTGQDQDLRYLNAVYADCDAYSLSLGQAVGQVIDAQDTGAIPPASVIVRSGRGIWLLWLLVRADDRT